MDLENGRRNLVGWLLTCMIMDECGLGDYQEEIYQTIDLYMEEFGGDENARE